MRAWSGTLPLFCMVVVCLCGASLGQTAIPVGTVIPARLSTALDSRNSRPAQGITARIMQDVPIGGHARIPAGTRLRGHIANVTPIRSGGSARVSLRFDSIALKGKTVPVTLSLRALASMMEVEAAEVPPTGTDRGTPWSWMTTNQIGGEVRYGEGGDVMNGSRLVGRAAPGGVLVHVSPNPANHCSGEIAGNDRPQAFWVFSSDACGAYGFSDLRISDAGRSPSGVITLQASGRRLHVPAGSGMLLRAVR